MGIMERIAWPATDGHAFAGDWRVLAVRLGFRLLPCAPGRSVELERTTAERIAWGMAEDPAEEQRAILAALARGLLLRHAPSHAPTDVDALSRALEDRLLGRKIDPAVR